MTYARTANGAVVAAGTTGDDMFAPTHDQDMAAEFLSGLDPVATKFTFQLFSDGDHHYAEVFHGSLDDAWTKVLAVNTAERRVGVFVTINETDFHGRRLENIVRPRALFVDADDADQLRRCEEAIDATGATPTMVVRTSASRAHLYWCCDDISLEEFSTLQAALIEKLGTDRAIKDLPRVMRLAGTLHLKDPNIPQLVTLEKRSSKRWKSRDLTTTLALTTASPARQQPAGGRIHYLVGNPAFTPADAERLRRKFGPQPATNDLAAGLDTNVEEIRSAVAAIPPPAITSEGDWVKFMRALAHEARIYRSS
jgi:RepB DNA-primase from phage plasmid